MENLPVLSFESLLSELSSADEFLSDPNFDPAALVGDIRNKVDGLKTVETRMDLVADYFDAFAKPIVEKAKVIRKNRERLREYIAYAMQENHFESVPGNLWKVRLRASGLSVSPKREPGVGDYVEMPNLVRADTVYSWDKTAIKNELGHLPSVEIEGLPFTIKAGYWPEFVANVPEVLEKKKRRKNVRDTSASPSSPTSAGDGE